MNTTATASRSIAEYRKSAAAERGIHYRLDRGQAGTTRATEYALDLHANIKARSVQALMDAGLRFEVGLLVEEEKLAERIRTADASRPELAARLADVRRQIRKVAR